MNVPRVPLTVTKREATSTVTPSGITNERLLWMVVGMAAGGMNSTVSGRGAGPPP